MRHFVRDINKLQGQTILTGDQHTDHISSGQRVSRHSLPTRCFLFFSHRTFFKNNFSQPARSSTFGFAQRTSQRKKTKRACPYPPTTE
jgi:hypothetical protein